MKGWLIGLLVACALFLLAIIGISIVAGMYNTLVTEQENAKTAWAQVENQLKRRMDLIPNYVEVVKEYAAHERETFIAVAQARAASAASEAAPSEAAEPRAAGKHMNRFP
jgi:LemA protein